MSICTSATVAVGPPVKVHVRGTTVVMSLALGLSADPPPMTVAVLVNGEAAFDATMTLTAIGGYGAPAAMDLLVVQLLAPQVHVLPPAIETIDSPVGGFSVTVTIPLVGPADALLTTM